MAKEGILISYMKKVYQNINNVKINPIKIYSVEYIDENNCNQIYILQPGDNFCITTIITRNKLNTYLFLDKNGFLYRVQYVTYYCTNCNNKERARIDYFFKTYYPNKLFCHKCFLEKSYDERRKTIKIIKDLPDTDLLKQIKQVFINDKWIEVDNIKKLSWKLVQGLGNKPGEKIVYDNQIVTKIRFTCTECNSLEELSLKKRENSIYQRKDAFYCKVCAYKRWGYFDKKPDEEGEQVTNVKIIAVKTKDNTWHEVSNENIRIKIFELKEGITCKYLIYNGLICTDIKYECKGCRKSYKTPCYVFFMNNFSGFCRYCAPRREETLQKITEANRKHAKDKTIREKIKKTKELKKKNNPEAEKETRKQMSKRMKKLYKDNPEKRYEAAIKTVRFNYNNTSKEIPFNIYKMYHLKKDFLNEDEKRFITIYTEEDAINHIERLGYISDEEIEQKLNIHTSKIKLPQVIKNISSKSFNEQIDEKVEKINNGKIEVQNKPIIIQFKAKLAVFLVNSERIETNLIYGSKYIQFESELLDDGYEYFVSFYENRNKIVIIYNNNYYFPSEFICYCEDCHKKLIESNNNRFITKYILNNKHMYCHECSSKHSNEWKVNGIHFKAPDFIIAVETEDNIWYDILSDDLETFTTGKRKYLKYKGKFTKRIKVRCENCGKEIITEWFLIKNVEHYFCTNCSALNNANNHVKQQSDLFNYLINIKTHHLNEYNLFMQAINYIRINRNNLLLKQSSPQMKVAEYLYSLHLLIIEEYPFIDFKILKNNNIRGMNIKGYNLFDAALVKDKIIIETLGDKWHESFIKYLYAVNYDFYHIQDELQIDTNLIPILDNNKSEKSNYCKNEIERDSTLRKFGWRIIYVTESQVKSNEYKIILNQKLTEYGIIKNNLPTKEFIRNNIHLIIDFKKA